MPDPGRDSLTIDEGVELIRQRLGVDFHAATLRRWCVRYEGLARRVGPRRIVISRSRLEEILTGEPLSAHAAVA